MALVTTPTISAVVAYIMKEKVGKYGPYQSVLFEGEGLDGGKLWRGLDPEEAQQLKKGMNVELTPAKTRGGKQGWNIRPLIVHSQSQPSTQSQPAKPVSGAFQAQPSPSQPQSSQAQRTNQERREQIEAYIFSMAKLHAVCYQAAEQAYSGSDASDEVIRAATSSVFIAAERRFHLTSSQQGPNDYQLR